MAFHSAQGPKLGLPQMIQSRAQFGYFGSLLPVVVAVALFIGFNVFNTILGGDVIQQLFPGLHSKFLAYLPVVILSLVLTIFGYELIHTGLRWATWLFIVAYGVFTIGALFTVGAPHGAFDLGKWDGGLFLVQFGVVVSYQLTWAPYVSEYSRYLPPETKTSTVFWWTYWGSVLGGIPFLVGAFIISAATDRRAGRPGPRRRQPDLLRVRHDHHAVLPPRPGRGDRDEHVQRRALHADHGRHDQADPPDVHRALGQHRLHHGRRHRARADAVAELPGELQQLPVPDPVLHDPVDGGQPDRLLLRPQGQLRDQGAVHPARHLRHVVVARAHRLRDRVRCDDPVHEHDVYEGPIAKHLSGGDISPFIGFPIAAGLYYLFSRSIDVDAEARVAAAQKDLLEREAMAHEEIGEEPAFDVGARVSDEFEADRVERHPGA